MFNPMRKPKQTTGWAAVVLPLAMVLSFLAWLPTGVNAQCTLGCNDLVQFSLDEDCYSEVEPDHVLENPNSCPGTKEVQVMLSTGQLIPSSPWVGEQYIGQTLTVKVTHVASGNPLLGPDPGGRQTVTSVPDL